MTTIKRALMRWKYRCRLVVQRNGRHIENENLPVLPVVLVAKWVEGVYYCNHTTLILIKVRVGAGPQVTTYIKTAQLGCLSTDYNSQRLLFALWKRRTGMAANSDELCLQIAARLEILIQTMRRMNELNAKWFGKTLVHRLWDTVLRGVTRLRWTLGRVVASEAAVGAHRLLLTEDLSNGKLQ
ncbi:unnamed protein product, partial [Oppiella nova]